MGALRVIVVLAVLLLGALPPAARAATTPPLQQLVQGPATKEPCAQPAYPECKRLRYFYGPLVVTPGNNTQLVGPVTIEKPLYDGYVTRLRPDLVRADGTPPRTDMVHLHHGTWLNVFKDGPTVPFFAAGEEKTIFEPRAGYGYLVRAADAWLTNYMLHNGTTRTEVLWLQYDIDFVPRRAADRRGIKPVESLWLDVLRDSDKRLYPVFNVQKGYGRVNRKTGLRECTYPRESCAAFDPFGKPQPGNGTGWDYEITRRQAGTLVFAAGHLHPGGLRNELSLVRTIGGRERVRRIFDSEARYFDPNGPVSWDMAMTATDRHWKVEVKPGDRLRLNAVYDSERASWYEGMGIMMAFVAPGDRSGVDPFTYVEQAAKRRRRALVACRRAARRVRSTARRRARERRCRARRRIRTRWNARTRRAPIDTVGHVTHGHLPENDFYGGMRRRPLPSVQGPAVNRIGIAAFKYSAGDLSEAATKGIPRVRFDAPLTFSNLDGLAGIWHTITTCKPPCTGVTGISYPIADDDSNLDSLELGYGPANFWPVPNRIDYTIEPEREGLSAGETYTYFCRIHPFMRGAFKVVK